MGQRHNRYIVTAGILTIIYILVPIFRFNTGETVTIFGLRQILPDTNYLIYIGAIGAIILMALIFAAIPLYRNLPAQKSLVIAAIVVNVLLYAFAFAKYFSWVSNEKYKPLEPTFAIGAVFPIGIFLVLSAAFARMRKM